MRRRPSADSRRLIVWAVPALLGLIVSCAPRHGPGEPRRPDPGWTQSGLASWYGPTFHGRPTASGEPYNMLALSAAHRSLPLGSWVRVVDRATGRWLVVRINDRGPFVRGRIVDLSYAAAKILGLPASGTAPVRLTLLSNAEAKPIAQKQAAILRRRGVAAWGREEFAEVEAAARGR